MAMAIAMEMAMVTTYQCRIVFVVSFQIVSIQEHLILVKLKRCQTRKIGTTYDKTPCPFILLNENLIEKKVRTTH